MIDDYIDEGLSYLTSKPSSLKHILCASISLTQSGSSSPLNTTHSSLAFFVSGQQQLEMGKERKPNHSQRRRQQQQTTFVIMHAQTEKHNNSIEPWRQIME